MDFKVHWKAPLQPKGFLKIIEFVSAELIHYGGGSIFKPVSTFLQFLAIIALSLVAGFMVETSVDFACEPAGAYNYTLTAKYPFRHFKQSETMTALDGEVMEETSTEILKDGGVPRAAEYFVGWGTLTLFYCVIAVLVYMLVTANERWERAFDFLVVVVIST